MTATAAPLPQLENLKVHRVDITRPEDDHIYYELHCDCCGLLEPHHRVDCVWRD